MRTETTTKTLYQFDELSDSAKETARQWWRDCEAQDPYDVDYIYDDAVQCGAILGIEIADRSQNWVNISTGKKGTHTSPAIFYSGFWSQGDGACFEGTYRYAKGAATKHPKPGNTKSIREHAPQDKELHRIADELQTLQRANFFRLEARMKHRGHYYHSGCMEVDVSGNDSRVKDWAAIEPALTQLMRDFADWIYKQLETEYEWRMSDEQVDESIRCNACEFTEEGERA